MSGQEVNTAADILILILLLLFLFIMKSWKQEGHKASGKMHNDTATRPAGTVLTSNSQMFAILPFVRSKLIKL